MRTFMPSRGVCRELMADTHRHLKEHGYAGSILVPGEEELFGFYERLGYRVCGGIQEFSCSPSIDKTELRSINSEEYAALRRALLPKGGVIQEKENLDLLRSLAELYAGDGFILAARREGQALHAAELLGDISAAPAIVNTLDCAEGRFRTIGNDRPFAMYLPFADTPFPPPAYFGLAFD